MENEIDRYPKGACELLQLPHGVPIARRRRPMSFSSASVGFLKPGHKRHASASSAITVATSRLLMLENEAATTAVPTAVTPLSRISLVTAIPPNPCAFPVADTINARSVANKQDYAHAHGFEVHLSAHNIDPTVKGNFNKLKAMQKLLNDTPPETAEWIWWLDIDTLIVDMSLRLPLEKYEGKDIVMWGERERVEAGDIQGLNTGSMLFRNCEWTRALLAELCAHAHREDLEAMRQELEKEVQMVKGFADTPLLVWALKKTRGNLDRVYFERGIGLNRHWLQVEWEQGERPLVVHYAGCTFCNPPVQKLGKEIIHACTSETVKAEALAGCHLNAHYLGTNATGECAYKSADLSAIHIRLGVR